MHTASIADQYASEATNTSAAALQQISMRQRQGLGDLIESAIRLNHKRGLPDVSMREVQATLEREFDRRVDMSSISGRINALIAANRIVRHEQSPRVCSITGHLIKPVSVPAQQDRFAY